MSPSGQKQASSDRTPPPLLLRAGFRQRGRLYPRRPPFARAAGFTVSLKPLSFWTVASEPGETLATSTDPPRATRRPRLRGSLALRVAAAGAGAAYGGLLERFDRRVAGFLGCLESALGL